MRRQIAAFVMAVLWLLVCGVSPRHGARARGPDLTGLDLVILIDQSESMWGARPNDRWNHRVGQAKNIIYRLAEHVAGTAYVHRVSVVDFGDAASLSSPAPLVVRYDPTDPDAAMREARAWAERYVTAKDRTNTNTPAAMALGYDELERMAGRGGLTGRRKLMLLLTDGRPDLGKRGADLEQLRDRIENEISPRLKSGDVGLWVVGLNDSSNYWNEGDGDFWQRVAGKDRARLAETASTNIATLVQDIVNEWLGVAGIPVGKEYECPPYLRRIIFNVGFSLPRSPVSITDPDGVAVPLSSGGAGSTPGTFARFVVDNPKPGLYKINQDPSRSYTSFVEVFSPDIQRLKPLNRTSMAAEARVVFRVTDAAGRPLEPLKEWPIKASVTVTPPAGAPTEIPAEPTGDGKFESRWKPSALGRHRLRLKGVVTLKGGSAFDVFGSNALAYDENLEVDNLQPYYLEAINPRPASGLRVFPWRKEAILEFALLDPARQRVADPHGVVKDPETWLTLQAVDKSGVALGGPSPLTLTPAGTFAAPLPVSLDWRRGEGWWTPGQLDLRVAARDDRLPADSYLDAIDLPLTSPNRRIGGDPLTVGGIEIRYSWWVLGPLLLLGLAAPALALSWLLRRLVPGLMFWWVDSSRGRRVELKIYDGNDDPAGDFAKRLPLNAGRRFNYDRQISLQVNGDEFVASKFRVMRDWSPDLVSVQIDYAWNSKPREPMPTLRVTKGRPQRLKGLPSGDYVVSLDVKSGA
ncbi:MAG: VWA domain-containing protein [Acidobacteriota bacterium]|nr:VWA domain-containing protein [Acidobacteriota bacterium]